MAKEYLNIKEKKDVEAWIIVSDLQVPYQDDRALAVVEKYMATRKWHGYIQIGDFMDLDTISSFNINKPRLSENRRLNKDFDLANTILDRHQRIIRKKNPDAEFVLLEGNHEERIERYLDQHPVFEGMLDIPRLLRLDERGFKWIKSWTNGQAYKVGKANFVHGRYTNQYHPAKMVQKYGDNIFYGHTHDMMCHAVANEFHVDKTIVGQSIGCLCKRDLAYMKGQPSNWQQGFMVLFVRPGGKFTYYTPRIIDHEFIGPDGILYTP